MGFQAVLFDWRGTLFHDEDDADWLRASGAAIGRQLTEAEVARYVARLRQVDTHPNVQASRHQADCSPEQHHAAEMLRLRMAGLDDELAEAVIRRDGDPAASFPYPDAPGVLRALKAAGVRVAVVTDIHYDLAPMFAAHGLADCVDAFALSYQHGVQKPDARLFQAALEALAVEPAVALMVGDRASRDGGAADAGITTLLLPPSPNFAPRGLAAALALAGVPQDAASLAAG